MKQMPYEPGSGRSTAPGVPDIKFHYERLASDPRRSWPSFVQQQSISTQNDTYLFAIISEHLQVE